MIRFEVLTDDGMRTSHEMDAEDDAASEVKTIMLDALTRGRAFSLENSDRQQVIYNTNHVVSVTITTDDKWPEDD